MESTDVQEGTVSHEENNLIDKFLAGGLSLGAGLQYYKRWNHQHNSNCEDEEDDFFCNECHLHRHHGNGVNGKVNGINGNGTNGHVCHHHHSHAHPQNGHRALNGTSAINPAQDYHLQDQQMNTCETTK